MKMPNNTIKSAKVYFVDELNTVYDASELQQLMEITFMHYCSLSKIDLMLTDEKQLSESELIKIVDVVRELKCKKPLAYILGEWEFYGLNFKVNEFTLIPRPETEELVELILKENNENQTILDIGTGTGCIPIALKVTNKLFEISACDISLDALTIAKLNAKNNKVDVNFFECDILAERDKITNDKYDLIVSNPPYITSKEKSLMDANVLDYEPHLALFVEDNSPLLFYDAISDFAKNNLNSGGKLYFEINEHYGNETAELLIHKGFHNVNIIKDINGKNRIIKAQLTY